MLLPDLRYVLRHLGRRRGLAFINIAGLGVGIACCLLLALFVRHELSYDRHVPDGDRIFRVVIERQQSDNVQRSAWAPVPLGPELAETFPDIEASVRFWRAFDAVLRVDREAFAPDGFYFTDAAALEVFGLPLLRGDPATALQAPGTVVLSASAARRYFGEADPLGRTLTYLGYPADSLALTVTGVMEDLPSNTHLRFEALASLVGVETEQGNWGSFKPIWTYVRLHSSDAAAGLEARLPALVDRHLEGESGSRRLRLEPLADIHLWSDFEGGFEPRGDAEGVYLSALIGLFILFLACINFINLSTARSMRRAREVGVRKTLGARRPALALQFLAEAVVTSGAAAVLGLTLAELLAPYVAALGGASLSLRDLPWPLLVALVPATALVVGALAGAYPALVLSRFRPAAALRGRYASSREGVRVRQGLVVFQFTISIALIVATLVVYRQLEYVGSKPLGFDREQVVVVPYSPAERPLLDALKANPSVVSASVSQRVPVNTMATDGRQIRLPGNEDPFRVESYLIDPDFLRTYRIPLVAGRDLSEALAGDSAAFLLNETAVRSLGWSSPEEALGQPVEWSGYKDGTVVGVVRDFHMASLHEAIEPLVLHTEPGDRWWRTFISVRIRPERVPETLVYLEETWRRFTPEGAYRYFFIDESLEALHRSDARTGALFGVFAALALFIAGLGIVGLAAFLAEQRTKELGIRKVLGATPGGLIVLLSKDFVRLVLLAFLLAAPLGYLAMQRWLDAFAYRASLGPGLLLAAGGAALAVALLAVSYQALRAARLDPVEALRYE